jgi:hypothetical protein
MERLFRFGEKALGSLLMMLIALIVLFWLLNLARGLPGALGNAADTAATHANGSAYGF